MHDVSKSHCSDMIKVTDNQSITQPVLRFIVDLRVLSHHLGLHDAGYMFLTAHVDPQVRLARSPVIAQQAHVRLLLDRVRLHVLVKVHAARRAEGAQFAVVQPPLGVGSHVDDEVPPMVRSVVADLTRVRLLACVLPDVLDVLHLVDRGVVAERTVKRFTARHACRMYPAGEIDP